MSLVISNRYSTVFTPPSQFPELQTARKTTLPSYLMSAGVKACTILVPSLNRVLKMRFAFWNMPSLRLTTMNCEPLNRVLIRRPMFWVCDRSSAASTSSKMYIGAGLNCSSAMMSERAIRDLCRTLALVPMMLTRE